MTQHLKTMMEGFLAGLPKQPSLVAASVKADWLLVNCIDCRYPHAIHEFMETHYQGQIYDHLVLAGASLATVKHYTHLKYWAKTFREHVALSIKLHSIDGVLVLDHRTCGAYVEFGLIPETPNPPDRDFEFDQHQMVAREAAEIILKEFQRQKRQGLVEIYLTPSIAVGGEFDEALPLARLAT